MDERYTDRMEEWLKKTKKISSVVSAVTETKSLEAVKTGITAFIKFSEANPSLKKDLRDRLLEAIVKLGEPYIKPAQENNINVVFIPPDAAPVMMITTCIPKTNHIKSFYNGLKNFLIKINEFTDPLEDIATVEEMGAALNSAQTKFKYLDIVAPVKPLCIVSLNNSHKERNCECGISADAGSREAVIFEYHPRGVSVYGRVFIFAHELGHALHLALTGDVEVIPDGFDAFNEALNIKWQTIQQKQEAFADVAAFAILNAEGLKKYLPHRFSEPMLNCCDEYIGGLTSAYFKAL